MHTLRAATKYGMILNGHSVPSWKIFYYLYIELIFFFLSVTKKNYKSEDTYCEISQRPEPAQYHMHRFILLGKPVLWLLCKLSVTVLFAHLEKCKASHRLHEFYGYFGRELVDLSSD